MELPNKNNSLTGQSYGYKRVLIYCMLSVATLDVCFVK